MSEKQLFALAEAFSQLPEVEAVVLGGSRANSTQDELSDYDLYVYQSQPISRDVRQQITERYCSYVELANQYWEEEDDAVLHGGTVVEVIYRQLAEFTQTIDNIVTRCQASTGYSTCFWYSLLHGRVLYEKDECFSRLQHRYDVTYPASLRQAIIDKNLPLLLNVIPAYPDQIKKAIQRGDRLSVQHRVTAYLESYFDVLFALNGLPHPGEKRLCQYAQQHCRSLPDGFEQHIDRLLSPATDQELLETVREMSEQLEALVKREM
ncbi:nucleotidyltransferase domain-containing protein [Vibrio sp. CAU 1672]|uniref:nucleotidyltransferase domain-containing protein n=1 Tax=Vibrio sp. CAU 1672 TaxID=3032594 RepID=UPI0023DAD7C9|nr:nucleotidyltransferase domain-containing protein [Vibrio sp. CAU 1672]MDF2156059.1 nucleotidyltransferase domain-containing protein [Vibrio sp. CAU 1672]